MIVLYAVCCSVWKHSMRTDCSFNYFFALIGQIMLKQVWYMVGYWGPSEFSIPIRILSLSIHFSRACLPHPKSITNIQIQRKDETMLEFKVYINVFCSQNAKLLKCWSTRYLWFCCLFLMVVPSQTHSPYGDNYNDKRHYWHSMQALL